MNKTRRIINGSIPIEERRYNILTFPTHERYETQLCKTGHNFFAFSAEGAKTWNTEQTPIPDNYYILKQNEIPTNIDFDFILVQSKFGQFQLSERIRQVLDVKRIVLEHTVPTNNFSEQQINQLKQMIGDVNVFISEYSAEIWEIDHNTNVINHGIDIEVFNDNFLERQDYVLTVANEFVSRDYCLNYQGWRRVTDNLPVKLVGNTPGFSVSASSVEELAKEYNECGVYFNSTTHSTIPMSLLEAMSCGCAVVSTATCEIPYVIENGKNGFISNDENELRQYIELLLQDKDLRNELGKNAKQTINEKYSEEDFIIKWNSLLDFHYEV